MKQFYERVQQFYISVLSKSELFRGVVWISKLININLGVRKQFL